MIEKIVTINNPLGIHARPAALIVQEAARFKAEITFSKDDVRGINGKSIMGVMMLAASRGTELVLTTTGDNESGAADALETLIAERFGEHE